MSISKELFEKAKNAKTAAELAEIAKAENVMLTEDEAEKVFADMHTSGELSDDELDNVSGGCGEPHSPDGRQKSKAAVTFLYSVGQEVEVIGWGTSKATVEEQRVIESMGGYYPYYKVKYKSSGSSGLVQQGHIKQI